MSPYSAAKATSREFYQTEDRDFTQSSREWRYLHPPRRLLAETRAQELHQCRRLRLRHLRAECRHGAAERAGRRLDAVADDLHDAVGNRRMDRGLQRERHGRTIAAMALRAARREYLGALAEFRRHRRRLRVAPFEL